MYIHSPNIHKDFMIYYFINACNIDKAIYNSSILNNNLS